MEPMNFTEEQKENLNKLLEHLTKLTVRIISFKEENKIGHSAGFLYQKDSESVPIVITAGHKLPPKGSFIETSFKKDGKPFLINAGEFKIFYNQADIDYAYSELPFETTQQQFENEEGIAFITYQHQFVKAKKDEGYGFAMLNNYEFVRNGDDLLLPLYCCHEFFLELIDQDEHINYFKPARAFQGHDYYRGASGSPITTDEGAITSILIGGDDGKEILRGFRLDNISIP